MARRGLFIYRINSLCLRSVLIIGLFVSTFGVLVACSSLTDAKPPIIISDTVFTSSISVDVGTVVGFGLATIENTGSASVTNLSATLVSDGIMHGTVIGIYAVESERLGVDSFAVGEWNDIQPKLRGLEVDLDEFTLASGSGIINLLFKISADEIGQSNWSRIDLTYQYNGKEYAGIIHGSFSLCAPKAVKCYEETE